MIGRQDETSPFAYYKDHRFTSYRPEGETSTTFGYDKVGNLTTETVNQEIKIYRYNSGNELTAIDSPTFAAAYRYSPEGKLMHKNVTTGSPAGTTAYSWNGAGQLTGVVTPATSATLTYDLEGQRAGKTAGGTTKYFIYGRDGLAYEKNSSGQITARYYYGAKGGLDYMEKNGQKYYFHTNHRGDVLKVTDSSHTVVARYSYSPWGDILESTGTFADQQPFRYAGYYWDGETGMYYLGARYYKPSIRRFISRDPIADAAENAYIYAENNPLTKIDPTGLAAWEGDKYLDSGDRGDYRNWFSGHWNQYVGHKWGWDCADLAIQIMADYAKYRKKHIKLIAENGDTYDSMIWDNNKGDYTRMAQAFINAQALGKRPKNTKKLKKWDSVTEGDLIFLTNTNGQGAWDTKVVVWQFVHPGDRRQFLLLHQNDQPSDLTEFQWRWLRELTPYKIYQNRGRRWAWQSA